MLCLYHPVSKTNSLRKLIFLGRQTHFHPVLHCLPGTACQLGGAGSQERQTSFRITELRVHCRHLWHRHRRLSSWDSELVLMLQPHLSLVNHFTDLSTPKSTCHSLTCHILTPEASAHTASSVNTSRPSRLWAEDPSSHCQPWPSGFCCHPFPP